MKHAQFQGRKVFIWAFCFFVLLVLINYVAAMGYINGSPQKVVSKEFLTMMTPAGYAFSIWGVIYVSIACAILWSIVQPLSTVGRQFQKVLIPFALSCMTNVAWIIAFSYRYIGLSAVLIVILFSLILMMLLILRHSSRVDHLHNRPHILLSFSFGVYAGWLSIASLVNFSAYLVSVGYDFSAYFGSEIWWYSIVLFGFVLLSTALILLHKNIFYALALEWAMIGIVVQCAEYNMFFLTLIVGIVAIVLPTLWVMKQMRQKQA